jgi:Integrase core domain
MTDQEMKIAELQVILNGLLEQLAAIEHERWSHWQRYLHEKAERQPDGSLLLPAELVARWDAQMNTPYAALRLGIAIERIKPGHPQQNGRHERMHLTLKKETTRPPGANSLQQQERFDVFVREFNTERPHEALDMKCPAEFYTSSARSYDGLPELTYPFHDRELLVTACGRLCLHRKRINISTVLAGQRLGIKEVGDGIWLVSFMHYDLGYFDLEQKTLQPLDNPFGPRLSPMS